jgi:hypothetical protein
MGHFTGVRSQVCTIPVNSARSLSKLILYTDGIFGKVPPLTCSLGSPKLVPAPFACLTRQQCGAKIGVMVKLPVPVEPSVTTAHRASGGTHFAGSGNTRKQRPLYLTDPAQ